MTPRPQKLNVDADEETRRAADGDRVVISGMAGLYPEARYIKDLQNILYNKLNPMSENESRWGYSHPEASKYSGSLQGLDLFDAQFFSVHYMLSNAMDPIPRKLLELAFEAIYDSGVNPATISESKVAVYVGSSICEAENNSPYECQTGTGYGIVGGSKAMFANRISYWLDGKGPSLNINQACCSSMAALEAACNAISRGACEAAVVGGASLCSGPQQSVHLGRLMDISKNDKTKSFAEDAAGFVQSEAINCLFLQKAKHAKRIYADVVHVKTEYLSLIKGETGPRFGFYRNPEDTAKFLKTFYEEAGVPPTMVEYVEGFGSAISEADKSELEAIDKVFCGDRAEPLLVGSVMSNIGFGEAASGISGVTKVLLGYHVGSLAGNMHCEMPRRDVASLRDGRMRVITDNHSFRRTYTAVNNMSITGLNAHLLLRGYDKRKDLDRYKTSIPRLVTLSCRQDSAVERTFDLLKSHPVDPEELALLHNIHETSLPGNIGKGYIILDTDSSGATVSLLQRAEYSDNVRRPLWFVYSGMGSQWAGMGTQLMRIPLFAAAIQRCHRALEPKGLDIVHIITSPDKTIFDNILHSFVGIVAVQIGLTDILLQLGLVPDKIIGHSMGELGCAYADGCMTAEEVILAAYSRGRISLDTPFIRGSMAAVGVGAQQISSMCPPEIEVACHNSAQSCTLSGPADVMQSFVADLTARGIFAKEVPCSNIAYHSRYIAEAGPALLKSMQEIIPKPRARSDRWMSTSVPRDRWEEPFAKYSSAEYHTNNLLGPVLFEETTAWIPKDAVLVEVAPHGLLHAILKRALPESVTNIALARRAHKDNIVVLLEAIGSLYILGYNPKVRMLYPEVEFPVATGTPFLSHYIEWAHQKKWPVQLYKAPNKRIAASCTFLVSIHEDDYKYMRGHVVNNKMLLPCSSALIFVWDTLAMTLGVPKQSFSVRFRDVKLFTQPILHEQKTVRLTVSLHRGTGRFEIMEANSKVANGYIHAVKTITNYKFTPEIKNKNKRLYSQDLYQIFYARNHCYSGAFRSIHSTGENVSDGKVIWSGNWATFIDGLIQLNLLKYTHRGVSQPAYIGKISIDIQKHLTDINTKENKKNNMTSSLIEVDLSEVQNRTRCDGVIIENINFSNALSLNEDQIKLETYNFVPRFSSKFNAFTSLSVLLQIVAENVCKENISVLGLTTGSLKSTLFEDFVKITGTYASEFKFQYSQISIDNTTKNYLGIYQYVELMLTQNLSKNSEIIQNFHRMLQPNSFIINEEDIKNKSVSNVLPESYRIISVLENSETRLELVAWRPKLPSATMTKFIMHSNSDLPDLIKAHDSLDPETALLIITSNPPITGLTELVKQWKKAEIRNKIYLTMIDQDSINNFDFDKSDVASDFILAFNVYREGIWGGEYYLHVKKTTDVRDKMVLKSENTGNINSLKWMHAVEILEPGVTVKIHYVGINLGDVKRALGFNLKKKLYNGYGMEFSGTTERGERVMGLVRNGAASTYVTARPELLWPVPTFWSLEDAATVPFAYVYAYYCLVVKGTIRPLSNYTKRSSYNVLIHGGAGALGQAAISIALARGWRVFTTVANVDKKRFLMRLFPQLKEEDIGNSRDTSFCDTVINATNKMGCNVVICCLKGDLKNSAFKCCGVSSVALDTTQILDNEDYTYGMYHLTNEVSYVAVDITSIFTEMQAEEIKKLQSLVSEGIASGEVRPLSRVTFPPDEAARAFRLLAASRHRGRVLLRCGEGGSAPAPPRYSDSVSSLHVICGPSPLGCQVADKLIDNGVKHLHLHFDTLTGHIRYKLQEWKKLDIQVSTTYKDLKENHLITEILEDAIEMGSVKGFYIIADTLIQENDIHKIDLITRKKCSSLKHFVVLTLSGSCGRDTCVQRAKSGLPATLLDLSLLQKAQDMDGVMWYRGAADTLQQALGSTEPVLRAVPEVTPRPSLIQRVAAVADVNINNKTPSSTSLKQLGMTEEKSSLVCAMLRDDYNTSVDEEQVPQLTIESLSKIEEANEQPFKEPKGLEMFYTIVDSDELLGTLEMVAMPTLASGVVKDGEFDPDAAYLCIVPGVEGHHERFRALCERLKLPALVLQPGLDRLDETPTELALRYSKILLKKTNLKKTFYILGFETGVIVALELAALLEDQGITGTVFCLGSGPEEVTSLVERVLGEFPSEVALQEAIVRHMFALMTRGSGADVEHVLRGCSSWDERVDACVRSLLSHVPHSAQYARAAAQAALARLSAARRTHATQPRALHSRVVLLRANTHTQLNTSSLQRYSRHPLHVTQLAAPLPRAAADPRVPAIINSYLDDDLLQAFEKKNLCNIYYTF